MIKQITFLLIILLATTTTSATPNLNNIDNIILDATFIIDDVPKYIHFENSNITEMELTDTFIPDYKVITTQENYNKMLNIYTSYQKTNKLTFTQKSQIFALVIRTPIFKYTHSNEIIANTSHLPTQNMNFAAKLYTIFHK